MKRNIYILLTMLLGMLLVILMMGLVEMYHVKTTPAGGQLPASYFTVSSNDCRLHFWRLVVLCSGAVAGLFLGRLWWHVVYVQKHHWSMRRKKR